jgi:K+-transporting ATPase KdpF subunit
MHQEVLNGLGLYDPGGGVGTHHLRVGGRLRRTREKEMNVAYLLSGVIALALLVYLIVALIHAEDL